VGRLATPAHDSDSRHKVVCPFFDDVEWGGVCCSVAYDTLCHSLYVAYLLLAGWDAMFAFRGRWGNGRDGLADCP